ncbi:transcriptional repressor [Dialister invisus]|uniref:transcriptional repressor n=1 Tax=Dialister invisus TaxID=218538 RepID=UPI003AB2D9EE
MRNCQENEHSDFTRTQMKKETILRELKARGGRITKQRKILLDIILEEQCDCCKEIYYKVIKRDPAIGSATVYRTISLLEDIGAISRNKMYEIQYEEEAAEEKGGFGMQLGQSMEDYLKTIYLLQRQQMGVRNVQIAEMMGRSRPSVTAAVNVLVEKGYVEKKTHGNLCLTSKGMELAGKIFDRHFFFQEILMNAGVDLQQAESEACMLEHVLSDDSFSKLKGYIEKEK